MSLVRAYFDDLRRTLVGGWIAFWFTPTDPATLSLIRILAGFMLLYTHAVWTIDLPGFFGPEGRISESFANEFHDPSGRGFHYAFSFWYWVHRPGWQMAIHLMGLSVFLLLTLGCWSRITSVIAAILTLSYLQRVPGALFGLDQINTLLAIYLAVGPCGARYSVDAWRARQGRGPSLKPSSVDLEPSSVDLEPSSVDLEPSSVDLEPFSVSANVAIRLIQVHLCVIYGFSALGKLQGVSWWEGTAVWLAIANYEYQSVDLTWMWRFPLVINGLTQATVAWELTYPFLVWPRRSRPLVLIGAVLLHAGIASFLGLATFGLAMIIANLAFVPPRFVRAALSRFRGTVGV